MNLGHLVGVGALVATSMAGGCVVIDGPITYNDGTGGVASTSSSSSGGGGEGTTSTTTSSTSTSSTSTSSTGTGGSPGCDTPQSDEFTGPSPNPCWKALEPGLFAQPPSIGGTGELRILPASWNENGWFEGGHGPFFYQDVTGDFIFVANALAGVVGGGTGAPTKQYNVAGILVRDPAGSTTTERWALLDIGQQVPVWDNGVALGRMAKLTEQSGTMKFAVSETSNHAAFGICRQGSSISLFYRIHPTGEFTQFNQPIAWGAVPATLQVGLISGTWETMPDVLAQFEYARFSVVSGGDTCLSAFEKIAMMP